MNKIYRKLIFNYFLSIDNLPSTPTDFNNLIFQTHWSYDPFRGFNKEIDAIKFWEEISLLIELGSVETWQEEDKWWFRVSERTWKRIQDKSLTF